MNSYLKLVKVFMTAISMSKPQDKKRQVIIVLLSLFAVFGILLPVTFVSGLIVKLMTETLIPFGSESLGIELMFYVIAVFTMLFGINVIFNEFYFSNDIEYLLPLPLRPYQIIASKFTAAFINENMMQFMLVLASVVGFGIATEMGIGGWLLSVIGMVTIPIVPMIYCGIFSLVVMHFTKLIRNKEVIQKLTVFMLFAFVLIVVASISTLQDLDLDHYVEALATGNQQFFKVMRIVLPTVPLFVKTFAEQSIVALIQYLFVTAVYIAVFLLIAEKLYLDGVIGLSSASTKSMHGSLEKQLSKLKQQSPAMALFWKEVKMLVRTPAFFTNCVAINFLWPIFVYAVAKIQHYEISLEAVRQMYQDGDYRVTLFLLLFTVGISIIMTAINSLGSNSISREGSQFPFMKYIPVPYFTQWHVKAMVSIVFSGAGVLVFMIAAYVLIGVSFLQGFVYCVLSLLAICLVTYSGILIDSVQPKLIWDDEMSALRENYNSFFNMAFAMLYAGVLCGGGYLLFCHTHISMLSFTTLLLVILGISNAVVFWITSKVGVKNIAEQEET